MIVQARVETKVGVTEPLNLKHKGSMYEEMGMQDEKAFNAALIDQLALDGQQIKRQSQKKSAVQTEHTSKLCFHQKSLSMTGK